MPVILNRGLWQFQIKSSDVGMKGTQIYQM